MFHDPRTRTVVHGNRLKRPWSHFSCVKSIWISSQLARSLFHCTIHSDIMSNLNVLVVGASIAGPTVAYWFAKAGAKITVIERFPKMRTNGQNIDIRTAGVTVMRKMPGMEAAVRGKTTEMEGISFVRDNGRPFGTIRATGNPDQQSLVSEYEIFRGDLAQILFDLTKDNQNIKYVFGEQLASMQQKGKDDGPITVEFANGLPTSEYDLVVACDGATSRTRAMGLGCGVREYIQPTNCWAAYFSIKQDLLKGSKTAQGYSAIGGRFFGVGPDPSGVNRVTLMGINSRDSRDATLPFREAMKQGDDALKQFVAQVRIFGVHVSSFESNIESRDMSREHLLFRRVSNLATPPQTSKTDSEMIISTIRAPAGRVTRLSKA